MRAAVVRVRPKWTRANGGSKGAGCTQGISATDSRKEPRVLIYALHACPAQSQLQLPLCMCGCVCVCVSKDTTYAHGDMPTHDFVDTRGRGRSRGRWQGPWLHLSGIYWFAKPATAADGASVHPGKD